MSSLPNPLGQPWTLLLYYLVGTILKVLPFMKINPAVAFTLILLTLMFGAGIVSSSWGYAIGLQALTGVSQPETRPSNAAAANRTGKKSELVLLDENKIIEDGKVRIDSGN